MKAFTHLLISLVLLIAFAPACLAQKNNLKATIIQRGLGLSYERSLHPNLSVTGAYISQAFDYGKVDYHNNNVSGLELEARLYLKNKSTTLSGFYVAPNFRYKRNNLRFYHDPNPGLGEDLFNNLIGSLITGNPLLIFLPSIPERLPIVEGRQKVNSTSMGLKTGYQFKYNKMSIDIGAHFQRNNTSSKHKGIPLNIGGQAAYQNDMQGGSTSYYVGLGFLF